MSRAALYASLALNVWVLGAMLVFARASLLGWLLHSGW